MWWFFRKTSDTPDEVVYTYGRETKEQSGEIKFNRHSEEFSIVKLAENDTRKSAERMLSHYPYRKLSGGTADCNRITAHVCERFLLVNHISIPASGNASYGKQECAVAYSAIAVAVRLIITKARDSTRKALANL